MNQILSLQNLCIPTILDVLKETFPQDNDSFFSSNPSLNLSSRDLEAFASQVLLDELQYDIENLAKNDPAAGQTKNKEKYVWESYKGLKAIMYYRIANHLLNFETNCLITNSSSAFSTDEDYTIIHDYMRMQARRLSERAATETTIEINPAAQIGKGFVIDHGVGTKVAPGIAKFSTVIGETCIIGDNCTLLNSVLLGAAVINEASTGKDGVAKGKRHPTLGNKVTVCAGVRILGDIKVGDNVTIGPCCVITKDVPAGYNVTIVNQLQYSRPNDKSTEKPKENKPAFHGVTKWKGALKLFGDNLSACELSIVTFDDGVEGDVEGLNVSVIEKTENEILFRIDVKEIPALDNYSLRIRTPSYEYILHEPRVLGAYIMEGAKNE